MEEGKRRTSGAVVAGRSASARVRYFEADRRALRRSPPVSRDLFVSAAPSAGAGGCDRGAVGGESRPAPAPILQPHIARQEGTSFQATKLEGFRRGHQTGHGN